MNARKNCARFDAIVNGQIWRFCWNPGTRLLTAWKKGSRKKQLVMSAESLVDAASGQMRLI